MRLAPVSSMQWLDQSMMIQAYQIEESCSRPADRDRQMTNKEIPTSSTKQTSCIGSGDLAIEVGSARAYSQLTRSSDSENSHLTTPDRRCVSARRLAESHRQVLFCGLRLHRCGKRRAIFCTGYARACKVQVKTPNSVNSFARISCGILPKDLEDADSTVYWFGFMGRYESPCPEF
jgi:hypothetical protein